MEIIDESNEEYEDPYESPDKDEEMPELQQENTGTKPIHKRMAVSKQKAKLPVQISARQYHEALIFKADILRKKYDIRNLDPDKIKNIFMKAHIKRLKERTEEGKISEGIKQTFATTG